MENVLEKNRCTGCTACMNICPNKAIRMIEDEEGFKYPVIDQDKCVDCGLCKKTCPVLNTINNKSINKCFVGYNKNEKIILKSSSGGVFSLVANYVLDNNGIVVGAGFDDNNHLKHYAVFSVDELERLRGSKYLQSDLNDIFVYIKNELEDKKVLFVGTPCQVAGLKAYLKKDYDNLICIDIICHGVPSPKLFSKYVKDLEQKYNSKLLEYNFRDKSTGWDTYSNSFKINDTEIKQIANDNPYMKLFLSDVALRESCYNCNFKLGNKYSDITLGDFWGINKYYPEMYNNKGVSCIIVNTNKGMEIVNSINKDLIVKECELNQIIEGNMSLKFSGKKTKLRDKFFKEIDKMSVEELACKCKKKSNFFKKVANKIKKIMK